MLEEQGFGTLTELESNSIPKLSIQLFGLDMRAILYLICSAELWSAVEKDIVERT